MTLKEAPCYSSDGIKWRCRKNGHVKDISIRKYSWFEKSNLTIEKVIELTYWWTTGKRRLKINLGNVYSEIRFQYIAN